MGVMMLETLCPDEQDQLLGVLRFLHICHTNVSFSVRQKII